MTLTISDIRQRHSDVDEQSTIVRLIGIRNFMTDSILPGKYRVPSRLHDPIALTDYGEDICRRLMRVRNIKWPEARIACFLEFYHEHLIVDPAQTDIPSLIKGLDAELNDGLIIHPFIWGRGLYDRAFDLFTHEPSELTETETRKLLEGGPRGVFQEMDLLTGPLGIIHSEENRLIPATISVPLYHCSRHSCTTVHRAYLRTTESQIHKVRDRLREILDKEYGRESQYGQFIVEIINALTGYFDDGATANEISFLSECFSRQELNEIALVGFKGKDSPVRRALAANGITVGDADDYLAVLDIAGIVQLLLLMRTDDLTSCIDAAIYSDAVKIPPNEVRVPKMFPISSGYYALTSECSQLGVRVISKDASLAMLRLKRLILEVYDLESKESQESLEWRLRSTEGVSTEEKLNRYLVDQDPGTIIRHLILAGPRAFSIAVRECRISQNLDMSSIEDEYLSDLILWKLGFEPSFYNGSAGSLRRYREEFAHDVASFVGYNDAERARIRRHSSNLFVALEKVLDASLSFASWALTYDHWASNPRFVYSLKDARTQMANILNSRPSVDGETVPYDALGQNTLFPLISGLSRLGDYLRSARETERDYQRPQSEMPMYAGSVRLTSFAFPHTMPFLNLSQESQERIIGYLVELTRILESGHVASVRNRLEHQRDDFPTADDMIRCLRAIDDFLDSAEQSGISPLIFQPVGFYGDSAGREAHTFRDYRGREYVARTPTGIDSAGMPRLGLRQIIFRAANIEGSTDVLRFSLGSESAYTGLWQGWPRHRSPSDLETGISD